jgi:hypothetical protein
MSPARTGRELVMEWLMREIRMAKTSDLHRMAAFLEWARQIRKGSRQQRNIARFAQSNSWRKTMDEDVRWRV